VMPVMSLAAAAGQRERHAVGRVVVQQMDGHIPATVCVKEGMCVATH
jgi:hypothetical protein